MRTANGRPTKRQPKRQRASRGFATVELLLVLPILMVLLLAIFEFAMLFGGRSSVVEASRAGARLATQPGTTAEQVERRTREVLGDVLDREAEVGVVLSDKAGEVVTVVVKVPMANASPNLLWPVGFSLSGRFLHAETSMVHE